LEGKGYGETAGAPEKRERRLNFDPKIQKQILDKSSSSSYFSSPSSYGFLVSEVVGFANRLISNGYLTQCETKVK